MGQLGLLFFVFGDSVMYAKSGINRWLPFLIIFGGIPFSIYFLLQQYRGKKEIKQLIAGASILLIGPAFGIWAYFKAEADLEANGLETNGLVVETFGKGRNVKCYIKVNGNTYCTFVKSDRNYRLKNGQLTTIIYSKRNPENNKIKVLQ